MDSAEKEPRAVPGFERIEIRPDLTDFDFTHAGLYRCKTDGEGFDAYQLDSDETLEHGWGVQDMVAGDWVVLKPSSKGGFKKSGVRKEAFDLTYVRLDPGKYRKESYIRAQQIGQPFTFLGVDSDEPEMAPAYAYIVLNLDKNQNPIVINGRRDIFYYDEDDLHRGYDLVA